MIRTYYDICRQAYVSVQGDTDLIIKSLVTTGIGYHFNRLLLYSDQKFNKQFADVDSMPTRPWDPSPNIHKNRLLENWEKYPFLAPTWFESTNANALEAFDCLEQLLIKTNSCKTFRCLDGPNVNDFREVPAGETRIVWDGEIYEVTNNGLKYVRTYLCFRE